MARVFIQARSGRSQWLPVYGGCMPSWGAVSAGAKPERVGHRTRGAVTVMQQQAVSSSWRRISWQEQSACQHT
jgi:hypothetical protein